MLGSILGAVGGLVGGFLNKKAADKANKTQEEINARNVAMQIDQNKKNRALSKWVNKQQLGMARKNIALQKEFAKSGIRWKVDDANAAGIHPLFALGAPTTSFSPVSVGLDATPGVAPSMSGNTAVPDFSGLADVGQNIGRAIDATMSAGGVMEALQLGLAQAQVQGAQLDNEIKRTQLASALVTNQVGAGPGIPDYQSPDAFDGISGDHIKYTAPTIEQRTRRDVTDPRAPHNVPGSGPSVAYIKNAQGGYEPIMPPELAESFESDWMGSIGWQLRNRILPNIIKTPPPKIGKPGDVVRWNTLQQHWEVIPPVRRYPDPYGG